VLNVHHIVPISRGGGAEEANLLTVCEACHRRLHSGSPEVVKVDPPQSNGFFCSNCDRFYSVDYGRSNGGVCGICGSQLTPWVTEKRD
jgi:transcription initiation factor IIE alpha subunit